MVKQWPRICPCDESLDSNVAPRSGKRRWRRRRRAPIGRPAKKAPIIDRQSSTANHRPPIIDRHAKTPPPPPPPESNPTGGKMSNSIPRPRCEIFLLFLFLSFFLSFFFKNRI